MKFHTFTMWIRWYLVAYTWCTTKCFTSFNHVAFSLLLLFSLSVFSKVLFCRLPEYLTKNYWKILYATKLFIEGLTRQDDGCLMSRALLRLYSFSVFIFFYCSCVKQYFSSLFGLLCVQFVGRETVFALRIRLYMCSVSSLLEEIKYNDCARSWIRYFYPSWIAKKGAYRHWLFNYN